MPPSSTSASCSRTADSERIVALDLRPRLLPYASRLEARPVDDIDMVVLHCTELPDLAMAREYGERIHYPESGTGNSGHYYVDRDGSVELWVPENRVAHHVRAFNRRSLGIELVNTGRYPHWFDSRNQSMSEPYPAAQIESLLKLIADLGARLPALCHIAGHEDLDRTTVPAEDDNHIQVARKRDPGEMFPWVDVLEACRLKRFRLEADPGA